MARVLSFYIRIFADSKNVIGRGFIQPCQSDQHVGGDVPYTPFVAAVLRLFHPKIIGDLLLGQVVIFPQITQSRIVIIHLNTNFHIRLVLTS